MLHDRFPLFEFFPDALIVADERGRIFLVNRLAEQLFGYESSELLGRSIEMLLPQQLRALHEGHRAEYLKDPRVRPMSLRPELTALRKDGTEFPVEVSLGPLDIGDGRLIMSAIRDVSARKRYERMLAVTTAELKARTEDYLREHRIAQRLQEALHFERLPSLGNITFDAVYRAAEEAARIGGDWYCAEELPDGRIFFSVGDIAGKGLQASVLMAQTRQTLLALAVSASDPASVLRKANDVLRMRADTMVTALCGFIDPSAREVTFASAGHPPPLLVNPHGDARYIECRGAPLGVATDPQCIASSQRIEEGSSLILYTDGILEFDHDILAAEQRLREAAGTAVREGAERLASAIFMRALGDAEPKDDIVVFAIRFARAVVLTSALGDAKNADSI